MRALKINVFIKESYNNVFFTLTNVKGQVILKLSQGLFKESGISFKRSKPFFYDKMIKSLVLELYNRGLFRVGLNRFLFKKFILSVFVKTFGVVLNSFSKSKKSSLRPMFGKSTSSIHSTNFVKYLLNLKKRKVQGNEDGQNTIKIDAKVSASKFVELENEKVKIWKNKTFKRYTFLRELYFLFYKIFLLFRKFFFINIILVLNGFFSRRLKYLILNLGFFEFLNIYYLLDFLPRAHNGCRPKKMRRL